jgi:adenylate cyclase
MKQRLIRGVLIALITFVSGSAVYYGTDLETTVGLDVLFKMRGLRKPPSDVVIVAMDEASENRFGVGQDLTRWRRYHAKLIQQLHRQSAALVVFDLQFIKSYLGYDQVLAAAMRSAGNVLIMDCIQKINQEFKEFSGREQCSESNKQTPLEVGIGQSPDNPGTILVRKIPPTAILARAALDHAPFHLPDDAGNPKIREVLPFLDMFSRTPTMPVVAWLYYLQKTNGLKGIIQPGYPLSQWVTKQRKQCFSTVSKPNSPHSYSNQSVGKDVKATVDYVVCLEDAPYLDYYGPPQTFRMESYSEVFDGKVSDLQGKVIFVGKSNRLFSPGKTDYFPTPFTNTRSGEMAGVEIMATQFSNLLEGRFIGSVLPPVILIAIFSLLIGLTLTSIAGLQGIVMSIALSVGYAGLAVWIFRQDGIWLPFLIPLLIQLPLSCFIYVVWSRQDLQKEIDEIMPFVLEIFPDRVADLPEALGKWQPKKKTAQPGSEREVYGLCLATDIEGYTKIAENYSDHQLWGLLQDYYQVLGIPIESHKGNVANVQGDAMMAYWLKFPNEKHRYLACLAALEMQQAIELFDESYSFGKFSTRIGLYEGSFVLGSGNSGKLRFSNPFGDTVNTASRIEGANTYLGTRILASSSIVSGLSNIVYRPVGLFRLKGRADPVDLAEIVGLESTLKDSQIDLVRQFNKGLYAFQQGFWGDAEVIFKALMENYGDGPSRFYWVYMDAYPGSPPMGWDGVVTLPGK